MQPRTLLRYGAVGLILMIAGVLLMKATDAISTGNQILDILVVVVGVIIFGGIAYKITPGK